MKGDCSGRERVNSHAPAMLHLIHGARDLESMVAQGFVKHGFKVLLHRVVDGPLQASSCLVSQTPCVYTWYTRVFVMFSISILCYFDSHHSCFIYVNRSAVAMVLDQERD